MSLWLTKKGEKYNASGQYWYSKYGIPIELKGSGSSLDKIRLKGEDGQFILTIDDEVRGTWQGKKGKELSVFM